MEINIRYLSNIDLDVDIITDNLMRLEDKFYTDTGYYPVNHLIVGNKKAIVFPDFTKEEYKELNKYICELYKFFPEVSKLEKNIELRNVSKAILLKKHRPVPASVIKDIENKWNSISNRFFDFFEDIFPIDLKKLDIDIHITNYGRDTAASYILTNKGYGNFEIYLRSDAKAELIAESIIKGFFSKKLKEDHLQWSESRAIYEFILKSTKLKKLFPEYTGTLNSLRESDDEIELLKQSKKFLNNIGYVSEEGFKFENNNIYFNGHIPQYNFTPTETKILKLLFEKRNNICSYFDIANAIWDDPDSFSIWAISRMIYKIRNKLQVNGYPASKLITYRGKGFVLDL